MVPRFISRLPKSGVCLVLIAVMIGCSIGQSNTPLTMPTVDGDGFLAQNTEAVSDSNRFLWSWQLVRVDPSSRQTEVIPVRDARAHWNILNFLEQSPCADCLKVNFKSMNPDGTLDIDVSIRHPFANPNLTGFDVRGIAMFNGSHIYPQSELVMSDRSLGEGEITNPDGYTTLFNPTTLGHGLGGYFDGRFTTAIAPNATLNAYKRFATDEPGNTRNAFYIADWITVTYRVDMPDSSSPWIFGYAVDASWAPPIVTPVDDPMTDFLPEANCPEAWKIDVQDMGPGLDAHGGTTVLRIDIHDWQGVDDAHPVLLECPELFDEVIEATWVSDGDGFSRYEAEIGNALLAPPGEYRCLVSREAGENDPVNKPWLDLTAYQVVPVDVGWPDGYPVDVTPHKIRFNPVDMCVDGQYVYAVCGADNLFVFDVSDPANPNLANWIDTHGTARRVNVSGDYAYVMGIRTYQPDFGFRFDIIDINPLESAYIVNPYVWEIGRRGVTFDLWDNYAIFVTTEQAGIDLRILDVESPESVQSVGWTFLGYYFGDHIEASDGYAYLPTSSGFQIINISLPEIPVVANTVDLNGKYPLAVSDGYAYIAAGTSGLKIVDVDPVDSAFIAQTVDILHGAGVVAAAGGYAYVANDFWLDIVVVDPVESAHVVSQVQSFDNPVAVEVAEGYAYLLYEHYGLQVIDIEPPESAYTVGSINLPRYSSGVAASEGIAYVADGRSGLQIVDVDPPEDTHVINCVDTDYSCTSVALSGNYAYVTEGYSIGIIAIDPPQSASVVNTVKTSGDAHGIAVSEGYAYVAVHTSGLQIIDIDPPESAYIVQSVDTPDRAMGVAISGGYAYVADEHSGLQIIDIDPPESAYIVSAVPTLDAAIGVAVSGGLAYVADGESGLLTIGISLPQSASIIGITDTPGIAQGVTVSGRFAYVADGDSGLQIIRIDHPGLEYIAASLDTPGDARAVAVSGNYAYIADYESGLNIMELW